MTTPTDPTAALKLARDALAAIVGSAVRPTTPSDGAALNAGRAALAAIDALPAPSGEPAEPLKGWKLNHVRKGPDDGTAQIGYLDPEDDSFSPILTVDTGLYYEDKQAHPLAVAILGMLADATAQAAPAPQTASPAPAVPADAEEWLRERFGVVRGHPEWRALIEAFNAGKAAATPQEAPARVPLTEPLDAAHTANAPLGFTGREKSAWSIGYEEGAANAQVQVAPDERPSRADLIAALTFYATGGHFNLSDESAWDTVSGEPQNWWCDEAGTATIEDGSLAKMALAGRMTAEHFAALERGDDVSIEPDAAAGITAPAAPTGGEG